LRLYFYGLIRQARVEQIFESFERFGESFQRTPSVIFSKTQHSTLLKEHTSHCDITLQELLNKFIKAKRSDGAEESTIKGYKLTLDFLIELFGAKKPINLITRDDCREFRDKIAKVPSNARKIYRDSTLLESIERRIKDNKPVLSVTTVNGQIKTLSTILNFAVREGLLQESPAKGLQTLKQKKSKTKRGSFTKEDLAKIFAHPLYTGCIDDEYNYNKPGKNKPRNHRFWVPLISLFTGMRLNEICQLFVSDIQLIDDVHVIQVRVDEDETKKLKTDHSERTVPISKRLIDIGFLDYAEKIRETGDIHLFPDIPISAEGSRSALVTKWFARFLMSAKAKRPETCFHSFRHTFRDECRANDITKEIVGQICGWKSSDDVMDRYGKGYELKRLQEEINKIHKNLTLNL
jgi:integrase